MIYSPGRLLRNVLRRKRRHVFICGCGHSGTTLLAKMLGAHAGIFTIPFETDAFLRDENCEDIRRFFKDTFYRDADAKQARTICEKTPSHIRHIDEIRQCYPGSRFIIPVRDARDVALSIKLRTGCLVRGYERWFAENTIVKEEAEAKHKDVIIYRYEDFIENVEGVLSLICRHIGVRFDPSMLLYPDDDRHWFSIDPKRVAYEEPSPSFDHESFRDWQVRQPIMRDRRNRWKSMLEADEIAQIEKRCGDLMSYFGYPRSDVRDAH